MISSAHLFPGAEVLEHGNCGYPTIGARRRIIPAVHGVSHITGNQNLPSALAEMRYSARAGSGASFPFAVNRNGTVVQGFDPFLYAPWTNGDINRPDTSNPLVAAMVGSPYNPNEHCLITIENVGYGSQYPITDAQIEANASIYAWAATVVGAKSISVDAVLGHRLINSVTRWNCPTPGDLLALRRRIVRRANALIEAPMPDTAIEDEEEAMDTIIRRVVGQEAVVRENTEIKIAPRNGAHVSSLVGEGGRAVQPFAVVEGDWYGAGDHKSNEWLVYVNGKGKFRYLPARRAEPRPLVPVGSETDAELGRVQAALEASNTKLAEKRELGAQIAELAAKVVE